MESRKNNSSGAKGAKILSSAWYLQRYLAIDGLNLRDANRLFEARLQVPADSSRNSGVENGSLVQVEGVCVVEIGDQMEPQSFHILMRTHEDIRVKSAPLVTISRLIWLALATAFLSVGAVILAFRTKHPGAEPRPEASPSSDRMRERRHAYARIAGLFVAGTGFVVLVRGCWMVQRQTGKKKPSAVEGRIAE